jgi:hypothetical protein
MVRCYHHFAAHPHPPPFTAIPHHSLRYTSYILPYRNLHPRITIPDLPPDQIPSSHSPDHQLSLIMFPATTRPDSTHVTSAATADPPSATPATLPDVTLRRPKPNTHCPIPVPYPRPPCLSPHLVPYSSHLRLATL